jgi:hypothetical protein
MKVYFNKIQNTSEQSITKFYFNKNHQLFDNLEFLQNKIKQLIDSNKTSESVKKQLRKLAQVDFNKYDCFYIYSNVFCFGIDTQHKTIDYYKNEYDSVVDLQGYKENYNCKVPSTRGGDNDKINADDF